MFQKNVKYVLIGLVLILVRECFCHLHCGSGSKIKLRDVYDFIIVGAGSAGSVVANRLSEIDNITVLLLEAGGEADSIFNQVPSLNTKLMNSPQDWQQIFEKPTSRYLVNSSMKLTHHAGKVLGGSSSINGLIYIRGNMKDYEAWNEAVGGGWSWADVLPYFRKSENNLAKNLDASYHARGGYLTVTEAIFKDSMLDVFLEANTELGLETRDVNGEIQTGFMYTQYTIRNGSRCSTNTAFLKSADFRPNLHIVTNALVRKVLFDTEESMGKRACGVLFQCGDSRLTALASKEVILSSGAVNSPHLLLLSGIGPRNQLKKFKIPLVLDKPGVGENLFDHIASSSVYFVKEQNNSDTGCPKQDNILTELSDWSFHREGPLTIPLSVLIGFAKSNFSGEQDTRPDIQLTMHVRLPRQTSARSSTDRERLYSCTAYALRVKSRGFIRLRNADSETPPIIDPRYLSNEEDWHSLLRAVKFCLSLANTTAFRDSELRMKIQSFPECSEYDISSEEYLNCAVQQSFSTAIHFGGTCKMGRPEDSMAVVDAQLRVYNISGLRVVDASIMPEPTSGNPNAPVIMIAEKASDMIKMTW